MGDSLLSSFCAQVTISHTEEGSCPSACCCSVIVSTEWPLLSCQFRWWQVRVRCIPKRRIRHTHPFLVNARRTLVLNSVVNGRVLILLKRNSIGSLEPEDTVDHWPRMEVSWIRKTGHGDIYRRVQWSWQNQSHVNAISQRIIIWMVKHTKGTGECEETMNRYMVMSKLPLFVIYPPTMSRPESDSDWTDGRGLKVVKKNNPEEVIKEVTHCLFLCNNSFSCHVCKIDN